MKRAFLTAAFVALAAAVLHAKDTSGQTCPVGYSLIGEACISDTTGDVVLPDKAK